MKARQLRDGFYWTGIQDEQLRVFDIIMYTEFGTTYNSYVMKTGDQTVLFETAKECFFEPYLEMLKEVVDVDAIDYLVLSHTEPDHAGSVERLLERNPGIKILATPCALGFLREIINRDFTGLPVQDGQKLVIGTKTLQFLAVPNLHWPDTMYTFIEEEQILVTCDSFGAHYCVPEVVSDGIRSEEEYRRALKYYFDHIIGPFKKYMREALERIASLDVSMICTGHGPVLTGDRIRQVTELYGEWSKEPAPNERKQVVIPYVSAYGYTGLLAEKIAEGVRDSGDVEVRLHDMVEADAAAVAEELQQADGFLLGTPTILGEALKPIWELTLSMFPVTHGGRYAGAFGSYGWSGEGVGHLTERLRQLNLQVAEGFRVRFRPDEADLVSAYEYGYRFGCMVQEKEADRRMEKKAGKLVKCLVCGEIFDASLEICPVCGVGKENFVPVEVEATGYVRNTEDQYVILGNGAAGYYAALEIRKRDRTGSIRMIYEEPYLSYNRPMLTKSITAGLSADQIAIVPEGWYRENRIELTPGTRVTDILPSEKEVELSDGTRVGYTKLIYALGSECFIPPIPGSSLPEVTAIRRLEDVQKVEAQMKKSRGAVVVGGGVLGLEAAWELKKAGLSVTVLEAAPVLMGRQLDEAAGEWLKQTAGKCGVEIRTNVRINSIDGEDHVNGVTLEDGERFPADLVIISAGVRANMGLARQIGLETGRGVVVNSRMETSLPGIYACGDCAEYQGVNYGVWPQAVEQGKTAGANAAGEEREYALSEPALTFHGMNTALYAAGDNGKNPNLLYKTMEFRDMGKGEYRKYYFLNNRLCGVILLGNLSDMAQLSDLLKRHASCEEMAGAAVIPAAGAVSGR